ncbi:MAG: prepilin-type N-terminal cleavage/methylation domain-containing protein [Myxococcota bacterium]|nr:prepilin-type N-terminal cleavage/methylation domain-containing protein [Myxococcota bacterium]
MRTHRTEAGFTLLEVVIAVAIMGVLVAISVPSFTAWRSNLEARSSARAMADVLNAARSNAIRSSTPQIVYLRIAGVGTTDPNGTELLDASAQPVEVTRLQDDDGDCHIDSTEPIEFFHFSGDVTFGLTNTALKVPSDSTPPTTATGATFADPENTANALRWLMFRPDGVPVAFSGDFTGCDTVGTTGSGSGAVYMTNGTNDFAAVISPLGGVRLHAFDVASNGWTF